ncbi:PHB depolymerase family esterase [Mariniflexile litorale]|uniref:PHB depolymerase family esterase n=1 Tax=Mariniflexile litorale TaxID=3045158 RepID=A0AAU7EGC3_9FLAO|nr:PHB depolymerase family esterase [Mariniflexile sp. KMM 9835]MDQ8212008.1 PHB depolymerase family esterase [Mariniflexile sp. KMM 9835]
MKVKTFNLIIYFSLSIMVFIGCASGEDATTNTDSGLRKFESIEVDGRTRNYILKLPKTFEKTESIPLVIFLHGFGGKAAQAENEYGMNVKADTEGFAVVYPEGVPNEGLLGLRSWNAGDCCDYAQEKNIDDVVFIEELIDYLMLKYPKLNKNKVYATGISNGAMMCYRLAAELSDKIAAIAPVSGPMMMDFKLVKSMPILHIHSSLDTKVPFEGGVGLGGYTYNSVVSTLETWQIQNNCSLETKVSQYENYIVKHYLGCSDRNDIFLYLTSDGGHSWPGSIKARINADTPSTAFIANDVIWEFFKAH